MEYIGALAAVLIALFLVLAGVKILKPQQRGAVFRLGRLQRVVGPGVVWCLPFVDLMRVVDLDRTLPGWKGLSKRDLEERIRFIVMRYPDIPSRLSESQLLEDMEKQKQSQEAADNALDLAKLGRIDEAVDELCRTLPDVSRDTAEVHVKFLLAREKGDKQLIKAMERAIAGQLEEATLLVCQALGVEKDRGRKWLEYFLKTGGR